MISSCDTYSCKAPRQKVTLLLPLQLLVHISMSKMYPRYSTGSAGVIWAHPTSHPRTDGMEEVRGSKNYNISRFIPGVEG